MVDDEVVRRYEGVAAGAFALAEFIATNLQEMPAPDSEAVTADVVEDMEAIWRALKRAGDALEKYVA